MALTIQDASFGMEEAIRQVVSYIIDRKPHLTKYYILIHAKTEGEATIVSKVLIMRRQPPKMLETICYEIDNRIGTQRRLWVLPGDHDLPPELFDSGKSVPQSILESAKGQVILF